MARELQIPLFGAIWSRTASSGRIQGRTRRLFGKEERHLAGLNTRASSIGVADREQTFHNRPAMSYRRNRQNFHVDGAKPLKPQQCAGTKTQIQIAVRNERTPIVDRHIDRTVIFRIRHADQCADR